MSHIETPKKLKRNVKLESFLKRKLSSQVFNDLRYYEGCVVKFGREGTVFKYVLLTSSHILLADQSFRSVEQVLAFSFVTGIRVVHDLPEFLTGPIRYQCQHIEICHSLQLADNKAESPESNITEDESKWDVLSQESISSSASTVSIPYPDSESQDEQLQFNPEEKERGRSFRSVSQLLKRVILAKPHIPRSLSSFDHRPLGESSSPQGLHTSPNSVARSYSSLDTARNGVPTSPVDVQAPPRAPPQLPRPAELHIYVVNSSSTLLGQLHARWCSNLLTATKVLKNASLARSHRKDVELLETFYNQLKRKLIDRKNTATSIRCLANDMHTGLQENAHLRRIFWKDQLVYHFLANTLTFYLHKPSSASANDIQLRSDELRTAVVVLETILASLQDSDNVPQKIQLFQFNGYQVLRSLLRALVQLPNMAAYLRITCARMLEDFNELNSGAWENLPEASLIRCSVEITNTSTSVLYELFLTMESVFSSETPSAIARLMDGMEVELEGFLKRSVIQLLVLLRGGSCAAGAARGRLTPADAVLVYKHFYVMACFMAHDEHVQAFVRKQFLEEFRYFISWQRVDGRIPDEYPVKVLLRAVVERVNALARDRSMEA